MLITEVLHSCHFTCLFLVDAPIQKWGCKHLTAMQRVAVPSIASLLHSGLGVTGSHVALHAAKYSLPHVLHIGIQPPVDAPNPYQCDQTS